MPKRSTKKKASRSTPHKKAGRTTKATTKRRATKARRPRQPSTVATSSPIGCDLQFENPALGVKIRYTIDEKGGYWFVMRDAADAMKLKSSASAARELPLHTKRMRVVQTAGGPQRLLTISEGGLYRLAGKTRRKGPAQQFTSWLYDDVATSIRRTGSYSLPGRAPAAPELGRVAPAPELPSAEPIATPAVFVAEVRSLVAAQQQVDVETEYKLMHDLIREVARQERCTPRSLALDLGYPPGGGKLFANVPLSEIQQLKETLRKRLVDQQTVTYRIVPRPRQATQRTSDPSIDYSPDEVSAKLRANNLGITPYELAGPMGIYDFIGFYPHSDPDNGDNTPYIDEPRLLYLAQFIKAHPTTVRLIRSMMDEVKHEARRAIAELNVEDRREPTIITTDAEDDDAEDDGDNDEDDDDDAQAAAE